MNLFYTIVHQLAVLFQFLKQLRVICVDVTGTNYFGQIQYLATETKEIAYGTDCTSEP